MVLATAAGGSIRLAEYRGRVVLLDVWASWCGPCRHSLPFYAELEQELGARGFTVIAVSVDEEVDAVRRFLEATPLPFPVVLDPDHEVPAMLGVDTMPQCFLLDRGGNIRVRHHGFHDGDDATLRAEVLRLLDGG